jgi:hypothetical protein
MRKLTTYGRIATAILDPRAGAGQRRGNVGEALLAAAKR